MFHRDDLPVHQRRGGTEMYIHRGGGTCNYKHTKEKDICDVHVHLRVVSAHKRVWYYNHIIRRMTL